MQERVILCDVTSGSKTAIQGPCRQPGKCLSNSIAGRAAEEHTEGGRNGAALPKGNPMKRFVLIAAATAAFALIPSTVSAAEPASATGCPTSNQVLVVAELLEAGYRIPAVIDAEGNANGIVCGKPLNPVVQEKQCPAADCPVPVVYTFRDDKPAR